MPPFILGDLIAGDVIDVANNRVFKYSSDNLHPDPLPLTQQTAEAASVLFSSSLMRQGSLKSALKKQTSILVTTSLPDGSVDSEALDSALSDGSGTSSSPASSSKSVTFAPKDVLHEVPCRPSAKYLFYDDDKHTYTREICSKWLRDRESERKDWVEEEEEEEDLDEEDRMVLGLRCADSYKCQSPGDLAMMPKFDRKGGRAGIRQKRNGARGRRGSV